MEILQSPSFAIICAALITAAGSVGAALINSRTGWAFSRGLSAQTSLTGKYHQVSHAISAIKVSIWLAFGMTVVFLLGILNLGYVDLSLEPDNHTFWQDVLTLGFPICGMGFLVSVVSSLASKIERTLDHSADLKSTSRDAG